LPRLGCMNIHASLLPRWRGAAPIHRAIEAGDAETGITIMQMDAGLDTGDMLAVARLPVLPTDTTTALHDRLATLGGELMVQTLDVAAQGSLKPVPQPTEGVTYAHKIEKAESTIDWTLPAAVIERRVRAFDPFPGASTTWNGEPLKVWGARAESNISDSNELNEIERIGHISFINSVGIGVACGEGTLTLTQVQRAGGKRLSVADFLRGNAVQVGDVLGSSDTPSSPA